MNSMLSSYPSMSYVLIELLLKAMAFSLHIGIISKNDFWQISKTK